MPHPSDSSVKSAARALDLLEHLAKAAAPQGLAELSDRLAIPKSSLFHLLKTLTERGYVEQKPGRGGYRLGPTAMDLAQFIFSPESVVSRVRPLVRELSTALQTTAGYYELRGDYAELEAASSVRYARQIDIPLARVAPLYASSWGKALLAHFTDAELDSYIARTEFTPFTPNTVATGAALRRQIEVIRREGFALSVSEYVSGMTGLATVLMRRGHVMGAVGVAAPAARYTLEFDQECRRHLTATAELFQNMTRD